MSININTDLSSTLIKTHPESAERSLNNALKQIQQKSKGNLLHYAKPTPI